VPIRIDLDARNKTGSVKVINEGDTLLRFQLKASRWSQDDTGTDFYEETQDLVFFPRILSIPPGEERMVRAGYKIPATDAEKTYRLFIEQIPEKSPTSAAQVSILIRFGVPIFSAPLKPLAQGKIEDIKIEDNNLKFNLINSGNTNLQIHSIAAKGFNAEETESFTESIKGWYLLNRHNRRHSIPLPSNICSQTRKIDISVQADKLDFHKVIELTPEQCGQ